MTTSQLLALKVAAGALRSGTDPADVADFLEHVITLEQERHRLGAFDGDGHTTRIRTAADAFYAELDRAEINHQTS